MNWGEWPGGREKLPSLEDVKKHCMQQLAAMRSDHMRALNPTPFKVCHMCYYNFILFIYDAHRSLLLVLFSSLFL
jgi:nicotinate phosphoribosyltransferase